jgi:DNA-binding GntR family transcriptional regulator
LSDIITERKENLSIRKVKKGTLKDEIADQIKRLILNNDLRPGQPIVIDRLAAQFGVSHTPVREALAKLELEGLVVLSSYSNPRVGEISAEDVREVYEMRMMVECWATEHAVLNLSDEQIEEIDQALTEARADALKNDYKAHMKADLLIHESILNATENKFFRQLAHRVQDGSIRVRSLVEATGSQQDILPIIDEHENILQALKARDSDLACAAMRTHLENGLIRTLAVL